MSKTSSDLIKEMKVTRTLAKPADVKLKRQKRIGK